MAYQLDHENIVEIYPSQNVAEMGTNTAEIRFLGERFDRTVYRGLTGPEILLAQSKRRRTYNHSLTFPIWTDAPPRFIYMRVNEAPPMNARLAEDRRLNPNSTWSDVAELANGHVNRSLYATGFSFSVQEAFGTLTIMREAAGWKHDSTAPELPVEETSACGICHEGMTSENSLALHCQHVYHKNCFLPRLWEDPEIDCLVCEEPTLLG